MTASIKSPTAWIRVEVVGKKASDYLRNSVRGKTRAGTVLDVEIERDLMDDVTVGTAFEFEGQTYRRVA